MNRVEEGADEDNDEHHADDTDPDHHTTGNSAMPRKNGWG